MRGLFERERRLLGLLARTGRDVIVASYRSFLDRADISPGLVVSIQTFGSYGANFHPHLHMLATDGGLTSDGEFLELPYFDDRLVEEAFRRRLIHRRPHALRAPHGPASCEGCARACGPQFSGKRNRSFCGLRCEFDPLICPNCGGGMKVISLIDDPDVIDAILRHINRTGRQDPFDQRAPPAV